MRPTEQEVFDRAVAHLELQDWQPSAEDSGCRYRLKQADGTTRACAVGGLIPDAMYNPCIEGARAAPNRELARAMRRGVEVRPRMKLFAGIIRDLGLGVHEGLLLEMQGAHDGYATEARSRPPTRSMQDRFRQIAETRGLVFDPVGALQRLTEAGTAQEPCFALVPVKVAR